MLEHRGAAFNVTGHKTTAIAFHSIHKTTWQGNTSSTVILGTQAAWNLTVSIVPIVQLLCPLNWAVTQPGVHVRQ